MLRIGGTRLGELERTVDMFLDTLREKNMPDEKKLLSIFYLLYDTGRTKKEDFQAIFSILTRRLKSKRQ